VTTVQPKPVVPLVGQPFMTFMLEWLRGTGSTTSSSPAVTCRRDQVGARRRQRARIRLRYIEEPEPLGTAAALKYAEDVLDERFLMLNATFSPDFDSTAAAAPARGDGRAGHAVARRGRGPVRVRARAAA